MKKKKGKLEVKQREAMVTVTTTVLGGQKTKHKRIKIRPFIADTAMMGVKLGITIPTGDYASARVDVSVFMPCYVEESLDALNQCYAMADKFLTSKTEEVKGG
jgi:hypothetical protein